MEPKYCAAPWRGLHINFRGDVKTCCAGDPNMLGSLTQHSIQDIVHGNTLRGIRETIQQGQLHPKYCRNCIQAEQYGRSERHWHNDVNQDFDPVQAQLDHFDPTIIDIRWNTTCNLSCNYCGPYCSSRWQSIQDGRVVRSQARPYYDQVCDFLQQHATDIREVAMVGGEPLLLPENERLLDVIPRDCIVTLITNTSVDLEHNRIFQKISQRRRVGWSMSFDNIHDRYEYVRHGGDWSLLNRNIDRIQGLMRDQGHWGGIHAVYNIYNCTRLVEFREWAHVRGLTVLWQNLFQPECLDPMQHGPRVRELALEQVSLLLDQCRDILAPSEQQFFGHARENLRRNPRDPEKISSDFAQHIRDNEMRWHKDKLGQFEQLWPELTHLLHN